MAVSKFSRHYAFKKNLNSNEEEDPGEDSKNDKRPTPTVALGWQGKLAMAKMLAEKRKQAQKESEQKPKNEN